MLTFRRAILAAAFFLTALFLISRSSNNDAPNRSPSQRSPGPPSGRDPYPGQNDALATAPIADTPRRPQTGTSSGQKPFADVSKLPLRDQLAYQYPYDVSIRFPAYIWQTWKYTPADAEFEFREQEASWTEEHPGFIHEVITDDVATALLRLLYAGVPEVLEAYTSLPLPVLRADFFRYLILFARGGIYSDIDTYALHSAIQWIPEAIPRSTVGLVIGIEADPDREDWADWYSRRIQFCQWTIQAKPGHPVLRETIARITETTLRKKRSGELSHVVDKNVIEFTGPAVWTDVIFDYLNDDRFFDLASKPGSVDWRNFTGMSNPRKLGDTVVLPITAFSPGVGQMGAGEYDDPMAMVKHDFEGTWKPETERHIGEVRE